MDRAIPKEQIRRERLRRWAKIGGGALALGLIVALGIWAMRPSVSSSNIRLSLAEVGTIEVSIGASGRVAPAFEEIIIAPITSRIVEVYQRAGDSVDVGTPLLGLDLKSIETEYHKALDQVRMKEHTIEQARVKATTSHAEGEMSLKVGAMQLDKMAVEVRNERYLDSIGAGTTDKVREVQLRYDVARLEQEKATRQLHGAKAVSESELKVMQLELAILRRNLDETKRILDDAQIRSPRKGVLTFINNQIGAPVSTGSQVATLSDLSHFRIDAEIADSYGDRISVGGKTIVRLGNEELQGVVSNLTPLSKNGVIQFTVQLSHDDHPRLRSGLKVDVHVMNAIRADVVRIANGPYFNGKGTYDLFVRSGGELLRRRVVLGDSNYQWVEVVSGLEPGEEVVISDMTNYKDRERLVISE